MQHAPNHFRVFRLALGLPFLLFLGCGESGPKLNPVAGKISYDGKPLTRGTISLRPEKASAKETSIEPYAEIKADGSFELKTGAKDGAPVGKYIVLVTATEEIDPKNASAAPKDLIPRKYGDPQSPMLRLEVVEKPSPNQYDIVLKK